MNRLSPLITRRVGRMALALPYAHYVPEIAAPVMSEDVRLFLTAWAGGLVFFATFLG